MPRPIHNRGSYSTLICLPDLRQRHPLVCNYAALEGRCPQRPRFTTPAKLPTGWMRAHLRRRRIDARGRWGHRPSKTWFARQTGSYTL